MKYHLLWQLFVLLLTLQYSEQMSCTYGARGSLTSTCIEATPIYFRTTSYRFDNLDETVRCVNCTLTVIESNTFDISGNQIKVLDLTKSQISVLKFKAFIGLVFLRKLLLPLNRITTIPAQTFMGINKVQYLDIQNNTITNLVTDGFKELTNLETLLLQNNYIKVIEKGAFNGLLSLETLDLSNNHIDVIEGVFSGLSSLGSLNLQNNNIKELQPTDITNVGNLIQLNLAGNQMKTVPMGTFISFSRLETLNLSSNPIESLVVGSFRGLNALEDLDLSNGEIPDVPKGVLLALHRLRSLDLSRNKIQNFRTGVYSGLPELRKLNLSHNKIENYIKTGLFPLHSLHTLDMSYNNLNDLDYKLLVDHMPTLSYLELSNNPWRCYIAKEMEEEFKHDNLKFSLGQQFDDANLTCNDTKSSYPSKEAYVPSPETAQLVAESNGHEYVLYIFIFISLGLMAYLFFLQFKNQKDIRDIVGKTNVSEVQLLRSSDMNARDDY